MNQSETLTSRFIVTEDPRSPDFVFKIPAHWWSRPHEYCWAAGFAEQNDVALDAACGMSHPLKFYLADHCREVYACDLDPRINSVSAIRQEIREVYGEEAESSFSESHFSRIHWKLASLDKLPYPDATFDKVYCISVLEHLPDAFNQRFWLFPAYPLLAYFVKHVLMDSLKEFKRILKPTGRIILTFDYPRINLDYFRACVEKIGLIFEGDYDFKKPANALYTSEHLLYCVRAVLRSKE